MPPQLTPLSAGELENILFENQPHYPVFLQILSTKRIGSTTANSALPSRYQLQISDGVTSHEFAMLAGKLNHLVESKMLTDNSIVRITRCRCSVVNREESNERRIILIKEMSIEHRWWKDEDAGGKVGKP